MQEFNVKLADDAVYLSLKELLDIAKALFYQSYQGWDNIPTFQTKIRRDSIEYSTTDEPYTIVDDGAKPHKVSAKSKPFLKFKTPFRAGTSPGRLGSFGSSYGNQWNTKKEINHPGFEARDYSGQVAEHIDTIIEATFDKYNQKV